MRARISPVELEFGALVIAVISMGRSLNLRVFAEGVETQDEWSFLQEHHCDEAQGYYLSRPMLPAEFARLLTVGAVKGSFPHRSGPDSDR
jgi:EAL domain-containing protein (putative c-di-GMP-specific phosphodiesterase class I)